MNETISIPPRPLTYDERRTLAYLLVAEQHGCPVTRDYERLPNQPDKKYESLRLRALIRARYGADNDTPFQGQLDRMLTKIDCIGLDLYERDLVEWMRANIRFVDVDDPIFLERWVGAKVAQQVCQP